MGALALAVAIGISGLGRAQPPAPGGGPHTRIALINLAQVFKGYHKVTTYANENKKVLEPYQEQAKKIQAQIEAWAKERDKADQPMSEREKAEKARKAYERQLQDLAEEAKGVYTKKNEEQMLIVYKEVMDAAHRLAQSQGYELVMHFNDVPPNMPEYWSAGNVGARSRPGPAFPCTLLPAWKSPRR